MLNLNCGDIMEYVIISLLILIILLIILLIFKNSSKNDTETILRLETNVVKEISDFKLDFSSKLKNDFDQLNDRIEARLNNINDKVNGRLDENFEKTNKTFTNVLERLSKIDEAQKKIDGLSTDIVSLQSVLTDKKTRGIFGEVSLNNILTSVFGDKRGQIYDIQHTLSNGKIADAILYAPDPLGTIAIDSKFPLENYQKMTNINLSKTEREIATKKFKIDVKSHIDAIANKYIVIGETSDEAIMFLPAEAIFAEINAYHSELIEYAFSKKVWITSPTTLMSSLSVIQMVLKNIQRDKYAKVIHEELNKLGLEFSRYKDRWDKLSRSIDSVNKDIKDIHTTTEKITKRFNDISSVEIKNKESLK